MSEKFVIFCENNCSMVYLDSEGDRMATFSLEESPTFFTYEEATAYIDSQCSVGSTAFKELYRPMPADEVEAYLGRDKSGWTIVDVDGLRKWGLAYGITDTKMLRDKYPHIIALIKAGLDKEAAAELAVIS